MIPGQYDLSSLRRAIKEPDRALDELKRLYRIHVERTLYNEIKYHSEKNTNSKYGFAVHWNQYQQGRLGIAQVPFFVERFIEKFDPVILTSQKSYNYHKEQLEYIFLYTPGGRAPLLEFDLNQNHTICALLGDPHSNIKQREDYIIRNELDYALTHYYHPFKRHFSRWDEYNLIHFPWAMPREFIVSPDEIEPGSGDLFVLGDHGGEAYETREWCSGFSFVQDPHRTIFENKTYSRGEYYKWLQQFEAVVAANSLSDNFRYVTAKFFEIPAAGALLFAQYSEDLNRLGFCENNCIIFDKDDFEARAKTYIESPEEYTDLRKKGAELIAQRHTIGDRMSLIEDLFSPSSEIKNAAVNT